MASLALSGQTTPVAKCSSFSVPYFHNTQNAKVQSLGKINNKNANVNQRKQKKRKKNAGVIISTSLAAVIIARGAMLSTAEPFFPAIFPLFHFHDSR